MKHTLLTLVLAACCFQVPGLLCGQTPNTPPNAAKTQMEKVKPVEVDDSEPAEQMNEMWGESVVKLRAEDAQRGQLFDEGNYATVSYTHLTLPTIYSV